MSNGLFSSAGISSAIALPVRALGGGAARGGRRLARASCSEDRRDSGVRSAMPSASLSTSWCAQPETPVCMRAPPISSSVTFSPITISAMRGEPRYIDALPSRMITTSQNAGM